MAVATSGLAGRGHALAYIVLSALFAALVLPVPMRWIWSIYGWLSPYGYESDVLDLIDWGGAFGECIHKSTFFNF